MNARGHYTKKALKRAYLESHRFYTLAELTDLIVRTSPSLVEGLATRQVSAALAQYFRRSVPEDGMTVDHRGKRRYLGASILYTLEGCYPETPAQLAEEITAATILPDHPKAPPKPRRPRSSLRLMLGVGLVVGIFSGFGSTLFFRYLTRGPGHILETFTKTSPQNDTQLFFLANANFDMGNFDSAERIARDLLSYSNLTPEIEGNCFRLLAEIAGRTGDYPEALAMIRASEHAYAQDPKNLAAHLQTIKILQADFLGMQGDPEASVAVLEALYRDMPLSSYKGYIALLISDNLFWLGAYTESLSWNERAYRNYQKAGDINGKTNYFMNQAWLFGVLGRYQEAKNCLTEARRLNEKAPDHDRHWYFAVTQALLDKCVEGVFHLPDLPPDKPVLLKCARFVASFSCATPERIIEHQPPPPPPPGGGGK